MFVNYLLYALTEKQNKKKAKHAFGESLFGKG